MSGPNHTEADGTRSPSGPDADAAVPAGPRAGRVMIEVKPPGAATIVIRGELDLVTMPFLAEQLTLISRDKPGTARLRPGRDGLHGLRLGAADRRGRAVAAGGRRPVIRRPGRACAVSSTSPVSTLAAR